MGINETCWRNTTCYLHDNLKRNYLSCQRLFNHALVVKSDLHMTIQIDQTKLTLKSKKNDIDPECVSTFCSMKKMRVIAK